MPDSWQDVLDLNLVNVWWTVPFLVGTVASLIHAGLTWQRWRATLSERSPRSDRAAALWFLRQDILSAITGAAMTAGGVLVILRIPMWPVWCLLVGASAFCLNKCWNLADDHRVRFLVRTRRERQRAKL